MKKYLIPLILISLVLFGASCGEPKQEDKKTEDLVYSEQELPEDFPEDLVYPGAICHDSSFQGPTEQVYCNEYAVMFYSKDSEEEVIKWYKQKNGGFRF